jgi:hypothetical protein
MSNFLFLSEPIAARLRTALDAAGLQSVAVLKAPEYTSVDGELPAPCVFVVLDSWDLDDHTPYSKAVQLSQIWQAVVTVRHLANAATAAPALSQSGDITDLVLRTLMGWQPAGASAPLQLTTAPKPSIEHGYYHTPVAVQAKFILHAI